jgi:hypothetical protein
MAGVDLSAFQFDYDLSWAAFIMNGQGRIYSRVFGRDHTSPTSHLSMEALQATLRAALEVHKNEAMEKPEKRPPSRWKTVDEIPTYKRMKNKGCVHCHNVNEYDRREAFERKAYDRTFLSQYPPPEKWGLTLGKSDSRCVKSVRPNSFADRAGLKAGDLLETVNDTPILSYGDLFFAMNFSPDKGEAKVTYKRDGQGKQTMLKLEGDWKRSDISWRRSIFETEPRPGFAGGDLGPTQRKELGFPQEGMAFQVYYIAPGVAAERAGLMVNDVITAIGKNSKMMDSPHFQAYFRTEFSPGDSVEVRFLRPVKEMLGGGSYRIKFPQGLRVQRATLVFPK